MISETKFYGGATYTNMSAQVNLHLASKRLQCLHNAGSVRVLMMPDAQVAVINNQCGHWFTVILDATSTHNVTVQYDLLGVATTIGTLTPGQTAKLYLTGVGTSVAWRMVTRTLNTVRTAGHGTAGSFANAEEPATYDPFCFIGTDCEFADQLPLNGQDGRPTVLAPMFQDVTAFAKNAYREAIRAADVVMPTNIVVRFPDEGCFVPDPLHPHAATVLSDEFYAALTNNDNPHKLVYVGDANGVSRNPYQMTWGGPGGGPYGWSDLSLDVIRHYWSKTITYTIEATGASHTIEIRFVLEHNVDPEPVFDRCGGGGQNEALKGTWGSLFMLYVFADEIDPTWVENDTFQPAGSADTTLEFNRDDPFVNGGWNLVDTVSQKFCHPQMAMMAMLPTTMHSPFGKTWVPLVDRANYHTREDSIGPVGTGVAGNRERDYRVDNGSPWCTDTTYGGGDNRLLGNIVFGWSISNYNGRAMSLGGDFPRSTIREWLCWENGRGEGSTYFQPQLPGWDEDVGELVLDEGNCGSILIQCPNSDLDTPSDNNKWNLDPHSCVGHPDEPFEGIGGSHTCFNNNDAINTTTKCCISMPWQTLTALELCTKTKTVQNYNCTSADVTCVTATRFHTWAAIFVEDYSYVANGNQSTRYATWARILPDPDQVFYDYAYDSVTHPDTVAAMGAWTFGATILPTTLPGSGPVKAAGWYAPAGWTERDYIVSGTIKKLRHKNHGYLARGSVSGGAVYGYGICTTPVTPGASPTDVTVELCVYNASGKTVLDTATITGVTVDTCEFTLTVSGTEISATVEPNGGAVIELSGWDLEFVTGKPGMYTEATVTTNIEFDDDFAVNDTTTIFIRMYGTVGVNSLVAEWPEELMAGYGQCEPAFVGDPDCGTTLCNCTTLDFALYRQTTLSRGGSSPGVDIVLKDIDYEGQTCTDGENPTSADGVNPICCGENFCSQQSETCQTCPEPFPGLTFGIVNLCFPRSIDLPPDCDTFENAHPRLCSGGAHWVVSTLFCS